MIPTALRLAVVASHTWSISCSSASMNPQVCRARRARPSTEGRIAAGRWLPEPAASALAAGSTSLTSRATWAPDTGVAYQSPSSVVDACPHLRWRAEAIEQLPGRPHDQHRPILPPTPRQARPSDRPDRGGLPPGKISKVLTEHYHAPTQWVAGCREVTRAVPPLSLPGPGLGSYVTHAGFWGLFAASWTRYLNNVADADHIQTPLSLLFLEFSSPA